MLKKKIKLKISLAEISYHAVDIGISFQWNQLRLLIPYHRLPLTASLGSLLEEFKTSIDGDITIYLECQRFTFNIEITEVKVNRDVIRRFSFLTSRIEDIIKQIKSLVEQDSLTFEKAQIILYQKGFQYDDSKVHRILNKIIDSLPPRKILEKVPFPLSNLNYHSRGIRFYNKDTQFEVDKNKLPVEVGPALERIKGNFTGDITFHIEAAYLQRWNSSQGRLQSGQMSREIRDIEINPNIPRGFKTLRNQFISDSIKTLINNASISLESVKNLLEDWGLTIKNQEIAIELITRIAPWTEEKDVKVPLKDISYNDDGIVVPVEGHNMKISAKNLAFNTHQLLDNIKENFAGDISIHLFQPLHFKWDEEKEQLDIETKKSVKIKLNIDEDTLKRLKKIYWLVVEKGVEIGADVTLLEQFKYPGDDFLPAEEIKETHTPDSAVETGTPEPVEKAGTAEEPVQEEAEEKEQVEPPGPQGFIMDLPRPVDKIPLSVLENKDYDEKCLGILEGMAEKIYMTTQDLWFRIGDRLIWERPGLDSETYVFEWPEEDLGFFVGKIWVAELPEIREDREGTGYVTRVNPVPEDITRWKSNLKRALKKKVKK